MMMWMSLIWFRLGSNSGLLCTWKWTFGFLKLCHWSLELVQSRALWFVLFTSCGKVKNWNCALNTPPRSDMGVMKVLTDEVQTTDEWQIYTDCQSAPTNESSIQHSWDILCYETIKFINVLIILSSGAHSELLKMSMPSCFSKICLICSISRRWSRPLLFTVWICSPPCVLHLAHFTN